MMVIERISYYMWIWIFILIASLVAVFMGILYMTSAFSRFMFVQKLAKGNKKISRLIGLLVNVIILLATGLWLNATNAMIVFIHLLIFWLIADLIAYLVHKKVKMSKYYFAGMGAILFTIVYLCIGAYLAYNVWQTDYKLVTDKAVGDIRVAMFADSHVGTTFDGEGFAKHLERIQETHPDVLIIAGDYVDDSSTKEDMLRSCEALGNFNAKYGVFYSFGNHDKGYYQSRDFSAQDLVKALEDNGVIVLEDEVELIDERFYIIGRQDYSEILKGGNVTDMSEITSGLDSTKYSIVIDHQPHDYIAQAASGVDLVLSGHTHGGQLIPINHVGEWIKQNDLCYGHEVRGNTNFIVTSGISDWAIKFKTGCKSEYVIVDIQGK